MTTIRDISKLFREALDTWRLLLQTIDPDVSAVQLQLVKWPDLVASLILCLETNNSSKALAAAERDLEDLVVRPISALYWAASVRWSNLSKESIPKPLATKAERARLLPAVESKRVYIECINEVYDLLSILTGQEYPRITYGQSAH